MGNYSTTVAHWAPLPPVLGILMDYLSRYAFDLPIETGFIRAGKFQVVSGTPRSWGPITFHFKWGSNPAPAPAARVAIGQHREKPVWGIDVQGNFELLDVEARPVANAPAPPGILNVRKLGFMPPTSTRGVAVCRGVGMKLAVGISMNGAAEQQMGAGADRVGRALEPMFDGMIVRVLTQLTAAARDSYAADMLNRVLRTGAFDFFTVQVNHLESLVQRASDYGTPEFKEFLAFGQNPEAYVKARLAGRTMAAS